MSEDVLAEPPWRQGLPRQYTALVVPPQRFAAHVDDDACARKLNGFDGAGRRCFVRHDHTAVVDAFDIDELPLSVALRHERRTAWRLLSGWKQLSPSFAKVMPVDSGWNTVAPPFLPFSRS